MTLDLQEAIGNILFSGNSVVAGWQHNADEVDQRVTREGTKVQITYSADGAACGNHGMVLSAFSVKNDVLLQQIEENPLRKRSNVRNNAEPALPKWQSVHAIVLCGFCKGKDSDANMKLMCGPHIDYLESVAKAGYFTTSDGKSFPVKINISGDKKMFVQFLGRGNGPNLCKYPCAYNSCRMDMATESPYLCKECLESGLIRRRPMLCPCEDCEAAVPQDEFLQCRHEELLTFANELEIRHEKFPFLPEFSISGKSKEQLISHIKSLQLSALELGEFSNGAIDDWEQDTDDFLRAINVPNLKNIISTYDTRYKL